MAQKKAKDLDSLLRLHNWMVDERRRELGVLLTREADLIALGEAMEREMANEHLIAAGSPTEAGFTFGSFAGDHRLRRERLAQVRTQLEADIRAAREKVAAAYHQLKIFDEVKNARLKQEQIEATHQEQVALDEVALNLHRRKSP